jgi:hypothetical protein
MLVFCTACDRKIDANVLAKYGYHDRAEGPPIHLTFLQCPRCEHALLVREEEYWENGFTQPETVYPAKTNGSNPELPDRLQAVLQEIRRCYHAKAYTATALLCRRAIETLCIDRGVKEKNLAVSLDKLREKNLIDGALFDWADGLRLAGNKAAHDVESDTSGQDARDLMEFTEALLEYVIVFREKFERYKERQARASTVGKTPESTKEVTEALAGRERTT